MYVFAHHHIHTHAHTFTHVYVSLYDAVQCSCCCCFRVCLYILCGSTSTLCVVCMRLVVRERHMHARHSSVHSLSSLSLART
jgi:hypothetical protein